MKKLYLLLLLLSFCIVQKTMAQEYYLYSPDSRLTLKISATDNVKYSVSVNGKNIIAPSIIGCTTNFLQNIP